MFASAIFICKRGGRVTSPLPSAVGEVLGDNIKDMARSVQGKIKMRGLVGSSASPLPSLITRNLTTVTSDHSSSPPGSPFLYSKRVLLIDTLGMVRKLEAKHVPSNQAEAIISAMSELLSDSLEDVAQFFVSKGEMHKSEMIQDSNLLKVKSEVQSSQVLWRRQ